MSCRYDPITVTPKGLHVINRSAARYNKRHLKATYSYVVQFRELYGGSWLRAICSQVNYRPTCSLCAAPWHVPPWMKIQTLFTILCLKYCSPFEDSWPIISKRRKFRLKYTQIIGFITLNTSLLWRTSYHIVQRPQITTKLTTHYQTKGGVTAVFAYLTTFPQLAGFIASYRGIWRTTELWIRKNVERNSHSVSYYAITLCLWKD